MVPKLHALVSQGRSVANTRECGYKPTAIAAKGSDAAVRRKDAERCFSRLQHLETLKALRASEAAKSPIHVQAMRSAHRNGLDRAAI